MERISTAGYQFGTFGSGTYELFGKSGLSHRQLCSNSQKATLAVAHRPLEGCAIWEVIKKPEDNSTQRRGMSSTVVIDFILARFQPDKRN